MFSWFMLHLWMKASHSLDILNFSELSSLSPESKASSSSLRGVLKLVKCGYILRPAPILRGVKLGTYLPSLWLCFILSRTFTNLINFQNPPSSLSFSPWLIPFPSMPFPIRHYPVFPLSPLPFFDSPFSSPFFDSPFSSPLLRLPISILPMGRMQLR